MALDRAKAGKEAHGEFESEHPGYCGTQDTFYVGNLKGMGRIRASDQARASACRGTCCHGRRAASHFLMPKSTWRNSRANGNQTIHVEGQTTGSVDYFHDAFVPAGVRGAGDHSHAGFG